MLSKRRSLTAQLCYLYTTEFELVHCKPLQKLLHQAEQQQPERSGAALTASSPAFAELGAVAAAAVTASVAGAAAITASVADFPYTLSLSLKLQQQLLPHCCQSLYHLSKQMQEWTRRAKGRRGTAGNGMCFAVALLVGLAALAIPSTHQGPTLQAEGALPGLLATVATCCLSQMQKQLLHTAKVQINWMQVYLVDSMMHMLYIDSSINQLQCLVKSVSLEKHATTGSLKMRTRFLRWCRLGNSLGLPDMILTNSCRIPNLCKAALGCFTGGSSLTPSCPKFALPLSISVKCCSFDRQWHSLQTASADNCGLV